MNLVLDDAEEVLLKKKGRKHLGASRGRFSAAVHAC
jgi:hypothetical protein